MNFIFAVTFVLILVLLYLFFRPQKGWWYNIKASFAERERIILEDILKNLYNAKEEGNVRNLKYLAKQLPFSESAIFEVVSKMRKRGLVHILGSQMRLSKEGEEYALRIVRAHRLWEHYLAEKTGYDRKDWHKLAEKEEHNLTDERLEELSKVLHRPLFDPHGSPIPYGKEYERETLGSALSTFPKGTIGRIVEIEDEPLSIYEKIVAENIHLGAQVEILDINSEEIRFFSEGKEHRLPILLANALTIVPLEEEEVFEQLDRLSRLHLGEKAIIRGISRECRGENRRRLLDLGFVKGTEIAISSISPMQDPTAYRLRNTMIALRSEQAQYILIQKQGNDE